MRETFRVPSTPYSLLLPIKQHDLLRIYSHKNRVPVAACIRFAIDLFLKNSKSEKPANLIEEIGNEKR